MVAWKELNCIEIVWYTMIIICYLIIIMCDHKIIVLMGGKRGLDAQRQRLEGAHCISATCIQLNSCLWHLLPSGKYGIAILERFDIPGEPVKSGGKRDSSLPLHPLLYVTICERLCESPMPP